MTAAAETSRSTLWTVVVAAGSGRRFGGRKQDARLAGRRVLDHSIDAAAAASDGVVVVVTPGHEADVGRRDAIVVAGGATRADSVRAGLAVVPAEVDLVAVHDGARPAAGVELWERCRRAIADGADGAVPAVSVVDSLKRVGPDATLTSIERSGVVAVQTPQVFTADVLRRAHAAEPDVTDDAAAVEAVGGTVVAVEGADVNIKVTRPADLETLERRLGVGGVRVAQGFDSHGASADPLRPCVLAGVLFDDAPGLEGHSDADVVAHAVADAVLSGAQLGDIGSWFPDDDESWAGADSLGLLERVVSHARTAGWRPRFISVVVVCRSPRLSPRRQDMEAALAAATGAEVSVSAKTPEALGSLAEGGTVMCWATATMAPIVAAAP